MTLLERIPQNGSNAVAARRLGYVAGVAAMGCTWSIDVNTVAKRSTFPTKHHGSRPEEAPYG